MRIQFKCYEGLRGVIPEPVPAKRTTPDWLKRMPLTVFDPIKEIDDKTVKNCPPFIDAMTAGFVMPLACDVRFGGGRFDWDWPEFPAGDPAARSMPVPSPLRTHNPAQVVDSPFFGDGRLLIKFINFWTIEVPAGYSLLFTHPFNRPDLPFRTLTGLVDCDRYADQFIHFPAAWTDDGFSGVLPKGTPVAQVIPVLRESLDIDMDIGLLDGDKLSRVRDLQAAMSGANSVYKETFRVKK